MPPNAPLTPGDPRRFGDLEVLGRLGEGGQGIVYLAREPDGDHVAVKWLQHDQSGDSTSVERFLREAEVARKVAPFCTAAVLGTGVEQERPYIVSEFVEGSSLQQAVRKDGPRTGPALDRLAIGTATALAAIHRAGIVHRDFKPGNVILGGDGPRVIDFGISRALDANSTISGTLVGTPAYMSPEQVTGHTVGPPSDMFSWAGTMVFASCQRAPFGSEALEPVLSRVLKAEPDLGRLEGPLREVVARCLSKDPGQRPTAEQVIKRLIGHPVPENNLLQRGASEAATDPAQEGASPNVRVIAGVAGAAVLAVVLVGALAAGTLRVFPLSGPAAKSAVTTSAAVASTEPAPAPPPTPTRTTLPGGGITLHEQPSDPITFTAYELYNKNVDDDVDYARKSLRGTFEKHPGNLESLVSPNGRYLAGRHEDYTSDGYDSILIVDRESGSSFRVKTGRKPLSTPVRAWSRDSSKILLNIDKKINGKWNALGFAIIDVAQAKVSMIEVDDETIRGSDFGWDDTETGVIAVYGKDEGLRFFDASGKRTRDLPGVGPLSSGTIDLFSPSGRTFVTDCPKGKDGENCLFDSATGKQLHTFSSDCEKVLGWYDERHLYCWEEDNATNDEIRVVAFDGKLVRLLLEVPAELDLTPYFTFTPAQGS
ncbi:protein kinase [Nonomuraea purpurea]|uniref:Protein kinase n=1 Tax=Nonomuraea purpurea TaxID=1849276 RepID=A0ABV8GIN8_9ACTN